MMMALASLPDEPTVLVPRRHPSATDGEDAGKAQSLGIRYAQGEVSLEEASRKLCNTCQPWRRLPVPRNGRHLPSGRGSPRSLTSPLRPQPQRFPRLAGPRSTLRPGHAPPQETRRHDQGSPHRGGSPQRHDRPRRLRRFYQPPHAPHCDRPSSRPATPRREGMGRGQPQDPALRGRPPQRSLQPHHRPTLLAGGVPEIMLKPAMPGFWKSTPSPSRAQP